MSDAATRDRSLWLTKAATIAPSVPLWLVSALAKVLANPAASSDGLLLMADALAEASDVCAIERGGVDPRHLDRLADLCRRVAPLRAPACRSPEGTTDAA